MADEKTVQLDRKIFEVFMEGRVHEAKQLLDSGVVDPKARLRGYETFLLLGAPSLLRYAVQRHQMEVANLLLSRGADPNIDDDRVDDCVVKPFLCEAACLTGGWDVVEHVLELGLCGDQIPPALRDALNTGFHTWPSVEMLVLANGDGPVPLTDANLQYLQWRHHKVSLSKNWEAFERTRKLCLS